MKREILVAPSLLGADLSKIGEEVQAVERAGADWLHIDVMDGCFVPPISFGEVVVSAVKKSSSLPLDTHLMILKPELHVESFKKAGSDRITIHLETTPEVRSTLQKIRELGLPSGLSIKPATPIEKIFPLLDMCDLVLIMSVEPGWGGQSFMEESLPRIRALRKEIDKTKLPIIIQVDGGLTAETAPRCIDAGVDCIVAGTYVYRSVDKMKAITSLKGA